MVCRINLKFVCYGKRDILNVLSNSEFITVRPIDELRFIEELDGSIRFIV